MDLRQKISGKDLADIFLKLNEEEKKIYDEINHILNKKLYDESNHILNDDLNFDLSFEQQSPEFHAKLLKAYDAYHAFNAKRIQESKKYLRLSDDEKKIFWQAYCNDASKQKTYDEFVAFVQDDEFVKGIEPLKMKEQERLLADGLRLVSFKAGEKAIRKLINNIKTYQANNKDVPFFAFTGGEEAEVSTLSNNLHMKQSDASIQEAKQAWDYKTHGFTPLHSVFKNKANVKMKATGISRMALAIGPDNLTIMPGIKTKESTHANLYVQPTYQTLYHEIGHANRIFQGGNREEFILPPILTDFYSNAEEFWNITLGKTSEHTLQTERKDYLRLAHYLEITLKKENGKIVITTTLEDTNSNAPVNYDNLHSTILIADSLLGRTDFSKLGKNNNKYLQTSIIQNINDLNCSDSKISIAIKNATITNGNFKNASLLGSQFTKSTFNNCDFSTADCNYIIVTDCKFNNCNFSNCKFNNFSIIAKEEYQPFNNCNFENVDVSPLLWQGLQKKYQDKEITAEQALNLKCNIELLYDRLEEKCGMPIVPKLDTLEGILLNQPYLDLFKQNGELFKELQDLIIKIDNLNDNKFLELLNTPGAFHFFKSNKLFEFNSILNKPGNKKDNITRLINILSAFPKDANNMFELIDKKKITLDQIQKLIAASSKSHVTQFFMHLNKNQSAIDFIAKDAGHIDKLIAQLKSTGSDEDESPTELLIQMMKKSQRHESSFKR